MGWVKDNFFGGAAEDAAKQQAAATEKASGITQQAYNQARNDILGLFPASYQQLAQGYQQAADVIGQGRLSSQSLLQQAFGNANQTMQSGNQSVIDALLGRQSAQQPQQQMPFAQQVPQTSAIQQAGQTQMQQMPKRQQAVSLPDEQIDPVTGRPVDKITGLRGGMAGQDWRATLSNQGPEQFTGMPVDMSVRGGDRIPKINQPGAMQNMTANPITGQAQAIGAPTLPQVTSQPTNVPSITPVNLGPAQQVTGGDFSGIGLSGAESALRAGLEGQLGSYQQGLQGQLGTLLDATNQAQGGLRQGLEGQLGAYNQAQQQATGTLQDAAQGQLSALGQGFGAAQGQLANMYGQQTGALQQGAAGAENALTDFGGDAMGELRSGLNQGLGLLSQGRAQAQSAIDQAASTALQGGQQAAGRIDAATGQAVDFLNPYSQAGQQALNQEAALSGAMGPEAQQQAINNFIESPGQKFLRDRQEQALLRNQAAVGGLRGGATLTALQEQAMGIAATQQQQQLENLRNLAGRGQQAAGQQGALTQQGGIAAGGALQNAANQAAGLQGQMAGISASLAGQGAGMANQAGQVGAGILQNTGQGVAGLRQNLGQSLSNVAGTYGQNAANMSAAQGQLGANVLGQTGQNIAGMQSQFGQLGGAAQWQYGQDLANLLGTMGQTGANAIGQNAQLAGNAFGQSGQQLSGLRQQAGQQVAQQLGATTNNLANNQMQLGQLLAGLDQSTAANLSNLLTGGATAGNQNQMQLAQLLANLATGQGTQLSNLAVGAGNAQAAGTLGQAQGMQGGLGMAVGALGSIFSDNRLKDNVTKLYGGAVNLYSWTWKHIDAIPEALRGVLAIGVIAQEVQQQHPDLVISENGYLAVNYNELAKRVAA